MELQHPLTKQTVYRRVHQDGREISTEVSEGEVDMTQQQQDAYKSIIGDANASVTVSRTLSHKDYGSGGDVFVSITLKCDQSGQGLATAVEYAKQLAETKAWEHLDQLRSQLIQRGVLKQ